MCRRLVSRLRLRGAGFSLPEQTEPRLEPVRIVVAKELQNYFVRCIQIDYFAKRRMKIDIDVIAGEWDASKRCYALISFSECDAGD